MRLRVRRKKTNLRERKRMHGRRKLKRKIKRETGIEICNLRRERMGGMGRTDAREGKSQEREISRKKIILAAEGLRGRGRMPEIQCELTESAEGERFSRIMKIKRRK